MINITSGSLNTYVLDGSLKWYGYDQIDTPVTALPASGTTQALGKNIPLSSNNQMEVSTVGAGTYTVQFSHDGVTWYNDTIADTTFSSGAVTLNTAVITVSGNAIYSRPFFSNFVRVIYSGVTSLAITVGNN